MRARDAILTMPPGALVAREEIIEWFVAWQELPDPRGERPSVVVFAPADGDDALNQNCVVDGARLKVFELALNLPTKDIAKTLETRTRECAATIACHWVIATIDSAYAKKQQGTLLKPPGKSGPCRTGA